MPRSMSRRRWLAMSTAAGFAVPWLPRVGSSTVTASSAEANGGEFQVFSVRTISLPSDRYYGWPTLVRAASGELLIAVSGGRLAHVCPFGRVELFQSSDDGQTWTYARTIADGPIDDRDAGILQTPAGTLLVTTFTSLAYEPILKGAESAGDGPSPLSADQLAQWQAVHRRLPEGTHADHLGTWMLRSEDGGLTWSSPYRVPVNSPHGPCVLQDGTWLYAGIALWEKPRRVGVCRSTDDGLSWGWMRDSPARTGDSLDQYHELHAVQTSSGRVLVQIRNHNSANSGETLQTHSDDGGRTWSEPASIGVWGLPSHLMNLSDGRVLMTYGHRRAPLGVQARTSDDDGATWSEPLVIYGDGKSGDLGYPSTAELADGTLLTVWYELEAGASGASLRAAHWRL
ncbi:MAG: sialidase family protein [Pirellulaceae bacterium]